MQNNNPNNQLKNAPIYKIFGDVRRDKKKHLAQLKAYVKMFWFYNDIDKVYGGGIEDSEANIRVEKAKKEIEQLELLLDEKYKQNRTNISILQ